MSKAEKFISEHTRNCSNVFVNPQLGGTEENHPWLTPDQARKAVEIAREELIEETAEWLTKHAKKYYFNKERYLGTDELVEDYKLIMSMKDEIKRAKEKYWLEQNNIETQEKSVVRFKDEEK